ncbi:CHAT domain-containing protein [Streptomyces sp. NPDC086549]|uniref:CHAT domain-containing protein n=1 Tax=Streptomyces sp. NPDC086549 TaxID=3365752 RepID=UPI0038262010
MVRKGVGDLPAPLRRALALAQQGYEARARFDSGAGGAEALGEAVRAVREALAEPVHDPRLRAVLDSSLASHLYHRWRLTGDADALAEAVTLGRTAARGPHPDPLEPHRNLCAALTALFETTTELALLDEAAGHGRTAVTLSPPGSPARAGCLSNLAAVLHRLHQFRPDPGLLDAAVTAERGALECVPAGDPARPRFQHNLATHLRARYDATRDLDALEESCALARAAADASDNPMHLVSAAGALLTRYLARGRLADAHEALALEERALAATAPGDPHRPAFLNMTSATLSRIAERTGEPQWARRAVAAGEEAVAGTPPHHIDRPSHLHNLSLHQAALFRLTGDVDSLRACVVSVRRALDALPPAHPDRGGCSSVLVETLVTLYDHTREPGPVDDAVRAARTALDEGPTDGAQRGPCLNNLSIALHARYGLDRDPAHLREAVEAAREAVRVAGDDPRLPLYLGSLCAALRDLSAVTGGDRDVLRELAAAARRALDHTPPDSPDRVRRTGELAWALLLLASADGDAAGAAVREAVSLTRHALASVPPGHPAQAGLALTLGSALTAPPSHTSAPHLTEATAVLAKGAAAAASPPQDRLESARALSRLHTALGDPGAALAAVEQAVDLLPCVAPRHLARVGREHGLERHPGLPQEAVAAALAAGRPGRAVELLERTRGLLLGEIIEARGAPVSLPPPLATEFVRLRALMAEPAEPPGDGLRILAAAEERRTLVTHWNDLLERIRRTPGHADFLRPPELPDLLEAADGPVVMVVDGPSGGHALIVGSGSGPGTVGVVPLPGLTFGIAHHWAARLREPLDRGEPMDHQDLMGLLSWLWEAVAEPVLTALDPAPGSRLWWCPTGPLALLPLHAAGRYGQEGSACSVLDRVVSSYTPTLRALGYARSRPAGSAAGLGEALVVAVPDPGRHSPLPAALREAETVGRRLSGTRVLSATGADRETVLRALPRRPVAHFACHGVGDAVSPAGNGVLLADGVALTVAAVAGLDLQDVTLAYLSACGTSETRIGLADESVHLASGFQIAGYPQVIGSLWSVPDTASARLADSFYAHATEDGRLLPSRVPGALHRAVAEARHRYPDHPELWAAFVHHGA